MRNYANAAAGLRTLMEKERLTPAQVSARTGIAEQSIRGILTGRQTAISTRNLFLMAQLFHMPMANLIDFFS